MTNKKESINKIDLLLVLDFEAQCGFQIPKHFGEIIEFPCVLFDLKTLKIVSTFHSYVRPVNYPNLTWRCKKLTKISQTVIDNSQPFPVVFKNFQYWLLKHELINKYGKKIKNWSFLTCSNSDFADILEDQLSISKIKRPSFCKSWVDVQQVFKKAFKNESILGLKRMAELLNVEVNGNFHSGIVDARVTADICKELILQKYIFTDSDLQYYKQIIQKRKEKLKKKCSSQNSKKPRKQNTKKQNTKKQSTKNNGTRNKKRINKNGKTQNTRKYSTKKQNTGYRSRKSRNTRNQSTGYRNAGSQNTQYQKKTKRGGNIKKEKNRVINKAPIKNNNFFKNKNEKQKKSLMAKLKKNTNFQGGKKLSNNRENSHSVRKRKEAPSSNSDQLFSNKKRKRKNNKKRKKKANY
ncbi:3'-5' exoribonuclease 1 [Anaeramoeba flamelloides]|uniref:3'-5' exoribonuclease 1 n=1 Tax=Anaeramoeba flamelloides TaxID=1746091 RepID=A0ABQ8Z5T3_9EUKA|nr:3'-5' exoribonuclease 1 [Anaeramoeba flamelloides]